MINIDKYKTRTKLIGLFILTGILPIIQLGFISTFMARNALLEESNNKLNSIREIKRIQIEEFFQERQKDMGALVEIVYTLRREAFAKLNAVQTIKNNQIKKFFFDHVADITALSTNNAVMHALQNFSMAFKIGKGDVQSKPWKRAERSLAPWLIQYTKIYGHLDLLLISGNGDIVFTVKKRSDLGKNVLKGRLRRSGLAAVFKKAMKGIALSDFQPYAPAGNKPASFFGAPVKYGHRVIGVVILQISIDEINKIMQERTGLGETGEVYLVGSDKLMRSDSVSDPTYHSVEASFANPDKGKVDTEASREALTGNSGQGVIVDYKGNLVLSVYKPLNLFGNKWAIVAEIDVAEAFSPKDDSGIYFYEKYIKQNGYYDLILINPDGYAFYTVAKETDYQTNLVNGKYSSSNLGKLTRQVLQTKKFGFADFEPYVPSNGEPASFIAQPVVQDGEAQIIVALKISMEATSSIMMQREGMGETGETYLVGSDKLMRSDTFLDPKGHSVKASFAGSVAENGVDTEASQQALAGNKGTRIIENYNGDSVLSSYTPLEIWNTTWALVAEIDETEVLRPVYVLIIAITVICLIIAVIGILLAAYITRGILKQLGGEPVEIANIAQNVSLGDLNIDFDKDREENGVFAAMKYMVSNLRDTVLSAKKIAGGDLTVTVNTLSDEDTLGQALQTMVDKLSNIVIEINLASDNVSSRAKQLSVNAQSMSQGATSQAAAVEEISSSMNVIAAQIKQNAENIEQVNVLAVETGNAAEKGNKQMNEMVSSMVDISNSSQNITKITKVIDEIAFQINLLSLNAAVEAARAGKYGKGFAVVADEVRNLATRSAKAASEISDVIETSVKQVDKGSKIAEVTATAFDDIVSGLSKITDLVGEVADASSSQAAGAKEITEGLGQIDGITQQNSGNAEKSADASEELASQAALLSDLINTFTVSQQARDQHSIAHVDVLTHESSNTENGVEIIREDMQTKDRIPLVENIKHNRSSTVKKIELDDDEFGKY